MKTIVLSMFLVLLFFSTIQVVYGSGEFDAVTVVSSVTDGDIFDTTTEETVRLADIDAPEYYEEGGDAATNYLNSTIYGMTVFLDIDDVYVYDYSGTGSRLVCVVYLDYNQTYYLNVNKDLLVAGYAELKDYDNEFNPYSWNRYVLKEEIPELSSVILVSVFVIVTMIVILVGKNGEIR